MRQLTILYDFVCSLVALRELKERLARFASYNSPASVSRAKASRDEFKGLALGVDEMDALYVRVLPAYVT
jgi:hypothetical protein